MIRKISALLVITSLLQFTFPYLTSADDSQEFKKLSVVATNTDKKDYIEGEVIVKYNSQKKQKDAVEKINSFSDEEKKEKDIAVKDEIPDMSMAVLKSGKRSTEDLIGEIKKDVAVEFVEPNYRRKLTFTPNDTYFSSQWSLQNTGQSVNGSSGTNDADIDTPEMWDIENSGASNTIIAVIDGGVDYNLSELLGNMWNGSVSCKSDTNTAISCPNHGWDYADNDNSPLPNPVENPITNPDPFHGDFVSSLIGAITNNGTGMAGASRYNHNKIMPIRFGLDVASEVKAINFARYNGAKIINASFVGSEYSSAEKSAIDTFASAGGIFITAAGNDGANINSSPAYPCAYSSSNIICVGATDQNDNLASFSNYSSAYVDIAAPGENMLGIENGTYYIGDGTSFSTPLVSGIVGVLFSQSPSASITTIKNALLRSSDHRTSLSGKTACGRRLNAYAALNNLKNSTIPSSETCLDPIYQSASKGVTGDWNNVGGDKIGLFTNGSWGLDTNNDKAWNSTPADSYYPRFGYGVTGAQAVTGDWNNDGKDEVGIFTNGSWYLDYNGNGAWDGASTDRYYAKFGYGVTGAQAVTGDWNNDGKDEVGIFTNGSWYLDYNGNGTWDGASTDRYYAKFGYGVTGAQAVTGDWNNDGKDEIGIFSNGLWYLDLNGNGVWNGSSTDTYSAFGK